MQDRRPLLRGARRAARALLALVVVAVAWSGPSPASATGSGTDRSAVIDVVPATEVVRLEVLDADDQVRLTVAPGHEVEVLGYEGEPWLHFRRDGTLVENVASPAGWLNRSADGSAPVPPEASVDAEPRWEALAGTRTWQWHDHRVHDMGEGAGLASGQIKGWTVDLVVDGDDVAVHGRLDRLPTRSPLPWAVLAAVVATVATAWGLRRPLPRSQVLAEAAAGIAVAGAVAGVVGASVLRPADVVHLGLALAGLAVVLVARLVATGRRDPRRQGIVALAGTALVAASGVAQLGLLVHPIVLSALPDVAARAAVACSGGLVVAVAGVLTWTGFGTAGTTTPAPTTSDAR